ncbi:MAG: hypothetical protein AB1753_06865 [Thermoproteota archaeon]
MTAETLGFWEGVFFGCTISAAGTVSALALYMFVRDLVNWRFLTLPELKEEPHPQKSCLYCGRDISRKIGQFCSQDHAEAWASTFGDEGGQQQ